MPVHGEGSSVWKELSAISDALLDSHDHLALYRQSLNTKPLPTLPPIQRVIFQTGHSNSGKTSKHTHEVVLEDYQVCLHIESMHAECQVTIGKTFRTLETLAEC